MVFIDLIKQLFIMLTIIHFHLDSIQFLQIDYSLQTVLIEHSLRILLILPRKDLVIEVLNTLLINTIDEILRTLLMNQVLYTPLMVEIEIPSAL